MKFTQLAIVLAGVLGSVVLAAPSQHIELIVDGTDGPATLSVHVDDIDDVQQEDFEADDDEFSPLVHNYGGIFEPFKLHPICPGDVKDARCTVNNKKRGCYCTGGKKSSVYRCNDPGLRKGVCKGCACG